MTTTTTMNAQTEQHLVAWIANHVSDDDNESFAAYSLILDYIREYPDMLDHSWPEIYSLAQRRLERA